MAENMNLADIAAVTSKGDCNSYYWIIILFALIYGGNGLGYGNRGENLATQADIQRAQDAANAQRLGYENMAVTKDAAYNNLSEMRELQTAVNYGFSAQATANCETKQMLMENRYLAAQDAANLRYSMDAKFAEAEIDRLKQVIADKDQRIGYLENRDIVRYPTSYAYTAGQSPFCGCNQGCCPSY